MIAQDAAEHYDGDEELKHHLGLDEWAQTDIIRANLQAENAKKCFSPTYTQLKEKHTQLKTDSPYEEFTTTKREIYLLVLFCLGFAYGCVFMLLSGLFARIV